MITRRIERPRSGIIRADRRSFPAHRAFIRRHACVVTLAKIIDECDGPIQAAHFRTAANSGTGLKPGDIWVFPCCMSHHRLQHTIGEPEFQRRFGLDLAAICEEFARLTTDKAMREMLAAGQRG